MTSRPNKSKTSQCSAAEIPRAETPLGERVKLAYIMSRFPKLTETFVLNEILAMEKLGLSVDVYPLRREHTTVMHPAAVSVVNRARFTPWISFAMLWANLYFLRRHTKTYLSTLWTLFRANLGSARYLTGALVFFPKAVYFAHRMAEQGIRHVHAHFASHPAAVAFVVHRLTGIPFSFTAHGSDLHRDQHMLREKVTSAAFVAAISQYNRNVILEVCGPEASGKVVVLHCGVDLNVFRKRDEPTPFERGLGPFQILCIGSLHEVKGQRFLVEACLQLNQWGIDFLCRFVGDGPDFVALQDQVRDTGLVDSFVLEGARPQDQLLKFLQTADVVAAPSVPTRSGRREGIPVVLMEAMASGVPVVASDLSGIPELVEDQDTGLLVPPGDATALAKAIRRLQEGATLRQRLAAAGHRKVEQHFCLATNARELADRFQCGGTAAC